MAFQRTVPKSALDLLQYLQKLQANRAHVEQIRVDTTTFRIEVKLDILAHIGGFPDIYLPVKRDKSAIEQAQSLVDLFGKGTVPSQADATRLWNILDPTQR